MYMYWMNGVNAHSGRTARTMHLRSLATLSRHNTGAETEAYEWQVDGFGVGLQRPPTPDGQQPNNQGGHHVQ